MDRTEKESSIHSNLGENVHPQDLQSSGFAFNARMEHTNRPLGKVFQGSCQPNRPRFVDGLMLLTNCPREISFMIAQPLAFAFSSPWGFPFPRMCLSTGVFLVVWSTAGVSEAVAPPVRSVWTGGRAWEHGLFGSFLDLGRAIPRHVFGLLRCISIILSRQRLTKKTTGAPQAFPMRYRHNNDVDGFCFLLGWSCRSQVQHEDLPFTLSNKGRQMDQRSPRGFGSTWVGIWPKHFYCCMC